MQALAVYRSTQVSDTTVTPNLPADPASSATRLRRLPLEHDFRCAAGWSRQCAAVSSPSRALASPPVPAIFDPVDRNFSLCADTRATRTKRGLKRGRNSCRASMKMSPFVLDRNVPLLRSKLPFPPATIVLLAAEPVKTTLRRAQRQRAVLTEPAASRNPIFLIRGNGNSWIRYMGHFY